VPGDAGGEFVISARQKLACTLLRGRPYTVPLPLVSAGSGPSGTCATRFLFGQFSAAGLLAQGWPWCRRKSTARTAACLSMTQVPEKMQNGDN
jgi:hypothetical protein